MKLYEEFEEMKTHPLQGDKKVLCPFFLKRSKFSHLDTLEPSLRMLRQCSAIVSSEKDNNSKFPNTNEQYLKIIQIAIIRYIFEQVTSKERKTRTHKIAL